MRMTPARRAISRTRLSSYEANQLGRFPEMHILCQNGRSELILIEHRQER